jgi:hypothetical protein
MPEEVSASCMNAFYHTRTTKDQAVSEFAGSLSSAQSDVVKNNVLMTADVCDIVELQTSTFVAFQVTACS